MAFSTALAVLLLASAANACLLPPGGCEMKVCNSYSKLIIPTSTANYSDSATWTGSNSKLAFVRHSFNKKLGAIGPNSFNHKTWLNMKTTGLQSLGSQFTSTTGPPSLPSLQYEFYSLAGVTYTTRAATGSLQACCNACRLSPTCAEYMYVPLAAPGSKDTTGTCYFITKGPFLLDGPFDWVDPSNPKSARTVNIGSPVALNKDQSSAKLRRPSQYPTFFAAFLGGYCNNHEDSAGVTDDPHFTGAHGTRFDFNGELDRAFCLLTDKALHINAVLKGYKSDNTFGATVGSDGKAIRSWIKEVGLVWTDAQKQTHKLHLVARTGKDTARGEGFLQSATLDNAAIAVPTEAGSSIQAGDLSLSFIGTTKKGWYDMDTFRLTVADQLDLSVHMRAAHPLLRTPEDAEVHFNLLINNVKVSDKVHGVLGQTYRNTPDQLMKAVKYSELAELLHAPVKADGQSGAGFLEGSVTDYEASGALETDCKMSAFAL